MYIMTNFWGQWTGPALNGTTQYIDVKFYDTKADWDNQEPNDEDTLTLDNLGSYNYTYRNQGLYAVVFQVMDTVTP